jgi:hypothetical protein
MREFQEYRITAEDGKILFCLFYDGQDLTPPPLSEKGTVFVHSVGEGFLKKYGNRLLTEYEENEDRLKRIRTAPLLCKITSITKKEGEALLLTLRCCFVKCGRMVYAFEHSLQYSERHGLFTR